LVIFITAFDIFPMMYPANIGFYYIIAQVTAPNSNFSNWGHFWIFLFTICFPNLDLSQYYHSCRDIYFKSSSLDQISSQYDSICLIFSPFFLFVIYFWFLSSHYSFHLFFLYSIIISPSRPWIEYLFYIDMLGWSLLSHHICSHARKNFELIEKKLITNFSRRWCRW
jgi:hypothetical protein